MAQQWRVTSDFTGNASPISSNLEKVDSDGSGYIGSDMTVSSGVFTFPTTGIYYIAFNVFVSLNGNVRAHAGGIETTTDNSSYSDAAVVYTSVSNNVSNTTYANLSTNFIFDVTNTSTHKCRFYISTDNSSTSTGGNTDSNRTHMTFIRLGDT